MKVSKPKPAAPVAPREHPEDRARRLQGEQYAREHGAAFAAAHTDELARLVTTYADADAQEQLDALREAFWSTMP